MLRRMTSSAKDRASKTETGFLESISTLLSNNKYLLLGGVVLIGGVIFALSDEPKQKRKHGLKKGATVMDAKRVQGGSSLRVGSVQTASMVRVFRDTMDADHSGTVDQGEWITYCKDLGVSTSIASHLFDAIDVNNDDSLEFEEIFDFVALCESGSLRQKLECIFSFLTSSGKETMTRSSCKKVLASGVCKSNDEAKNIMRSIFQAGNAASSGSISRSDFVEGLLVSDSDTTSVVVRLAVNIVECVCNPDVISKHKMYT